MSLFIRDLNRTIAYTEQVEEAYRSLAKTMKLRHMGLVPRVLEVSLTVTPIRRMLRGIYGSNWVVVWALMFAAAENTWSAWHGTAWRFWRYRICLHSQERDWNELTSDSESPDEDDQV